MRNIYNKYVYTYINTCQLHNHFNFRMFMYQFYLHLAINELTHSYHILKRKIELTIKNGFTIYYK